MQAHRIVYELAPGDALHEAVELGAVSDDTKEALRVVGGKPEHAQTSLGGPDEPRHQVHQRSLAGTVRSDQARDAGLDGEADAVDAEHVAIKLRDVFKKDELVQG